MMRQSGGQPQRQAPQPANPFDNPFGKILQDMFGGAMGQAAPLMPDVTLAKDADTAAKGADAPARRGLDYDGPAGA